MLDLDDFGNVSGPQESLDGERMAKSQEMLATSALKGRNRTAFGAQGATYPLEPQKRKLLGSSRLNASQNCVFSSSGSCSSAS
jgi:hypothetical protein